MLLLVLARLISVPTVVSSVMPVASRAVVVPAGASTIAPSHWPNTLTNTSRLLLATTSCPVRLNTVIFVADVPVVALPLLVLLVTVASPVVAVVDRSFVMLWLFVLTTSKLPSAKDSLLAAIVLR